MLYTKAQYPAEVIKYFWMVFLEIPLNASRLVFSWRVTYMCPGHNYVLHACTPCSCVWSSLISINCKLWLIVTKLLMWVQLVWALYILARCFTVAIHINIQQVLGVTFNCAPLPALCPEPLFLPKLRPTHKKNIYKLIARICCFNLNSVEPCTKFHSFQGSLVSMSKLYNC